jgi:hypothetical protein
MPLQQINWLQIDTANVPSGSVIDLGAVSGTLHAVYADNLFVSGLSLQDYINQAGTTELNLYSASLKAALETTGSNLTVKGNLLVKGTTTSINSTTVDIGDNVIELNGTEAGFGGLLIKDPTNPNKISGSLLWDAANDYWVAGPLGSEEKVVLISELTNLSSSVATTIENVGIFRETGSFYATTNDLQVTGSLKIKGDLEVFGKTTLVQKLDPNVESLVVSGAMKIMQNQINSQIVRAQLQIQNLGTIADVANNSIIDCGDGFF